MIVVEETFNVVEVDGITNDEVRDVVSREETDGGNKIFVGGWLIIIELEVIEHVDANTFSIIACSLNGHTPKVKSK